MNTLSLLFFTGWLLSLAPLAFAQATTYADTTTAAPLLVLETRSGFVPPEYARAKSCQVFTDKIVIIEAYGAGSGSFQTQTEVNFRMRGDIGIALTKAASEKELSEGPIACDLPTARVFALPPQGSTELMLFDSGGCGGDMKWRRGPFSTALLQVVEKACSFDVPEKALY